MASDPRLDLWSGRLRQQIFLGDAAFADRMRALAARAQSNGGRRSGKQRSWADWLRDSESREQALYRAHTEGGLSMTSLAETLSLSVSRISRLIAGYESTHEVAA